MNKDNSAKDKQKNMGSNKHDPDMNNQSAKKSVGFYLERFPKEFKRNIFQNVDKRFLIILLLSFLVNIGTIFYLEHLIPEDLDSQKISKIQKQYANLLLDREFDSPGVGRSVRREVYDFEGEIVSGLSEWMESLTVDIFETLENLETPELPMGELKLDEPGGLSKEDIQQLRESSSQRRSAARSDRESRMSDVGILGVISGSNRSVDQEYIQDLMEYANRNSDHLAQVLSKLNKIEVPHSGKKLNIKKIQGISASDQYASIRGERKDATNEVSKFIENMEPIKEAETKMVTRNLQYEEIESSYLNQSANRKRERLTRKSSDVVRIVRSHMRALEDCYKLALKKNPDLKGKIVIRFTINPEGEVIFASAISSTLNNPQMENCLLNKIKRWRNFPPCDPNFGNKTYRQSFKFGI